MRWSRLRHVLVFWTTDTDEINARIREDLEESGANLEAVKQVELEILTQSSSSSSSSLELVRHTVPVISLSNSIPSKLRVPEMNRLPLA